MISLIRPAVLMALVLTVLTGLVYPLAVTGVAQLCFPSQAGGSRAWEAELRAEMLHDR